MSVAVEVGEAVGAAVEVWRVCLCACQMVSGLSAKSFLKKFLGK